MRTVGNKLSPEGDGFTLIELLVVIGIIGILASLLLSSFSGALRRSKETVCYSNFRQIGIMFRLYGDEHEDGFPRGDFRRYNPVLDVTHRMRQTMAVGGRDAKGGHFSAVVPPAEKRPLYPYQGNAEVFRCPVDKGHKAFPEFPVCDPQHHEAMPSMWETLGSSYHYNARLEAPWDPSRAPPLPIATKKRVWKPLPKMTYADVIHPDRYILMNEPPAQPLGRIIAPNTVVYHWSQWHRRRGRSDFADPTIAPNLFWSPILFVDGHVSGHNFSRSVMTDPYYPYEETRDWIWYQPE